MAQTLPPFLIDMDGTLLDSIAAVERAWGEFADEHGLDLAAVIAYAHGRPTWQTIAHFLPHHPDPLAVAGRLEQREESIVEGIVEVPGAADFVRALPSHRWALVTSAGRALATLRLGIAGVPLPEVCVFADDVERGKPDPEPYLLGARRLGVRPEDCIVLEDSAPGLDSGLAAGARAVVIGGLTAYDDRVPRLPDLRGVTPEGLAHLVARGAVGPIPR